MHCLISITIIASALVAVTCAVLILSSEIEGPEEIQIKREAMYNAAHKGRPPPAAFVLNEHASDTCNGTHFGP